MDVWVQALHERAIQRVHLLGVRLGHGNPSQAPGKRLLAGLFCLLGGRSPGGELLVELGFDLLVIWRLALVCLRLRKGVATLCAPGGNLRLEELLLPAADLYGVVHVYLRELLEFYVLDLRDYVQDVRAHLADGALELLCCGRCHCHGGHHPLDVWFLTP